MDMARRRVDLRLDEELLARLDAEAERLGQTRTKFIERALESALGSVIPADTSGPAATRDRGESVPNARSAAPSRASEPPPSKPSPEPAVPPSRVSSKAKRLSEAESVLSQANWAMERQAALNKAKGS